jgi:hypothetical protein
MAEDKLAGLLSSDHELRLATRALSRHGQGRMRHGGRRGKPQESDQNRFRECEHHTKVHKPALAVTLSRFLTHSAFTLSVHL